MHKGPDQTAEPFQAAYGPIGPQTPMDHIRNGFDQFGMPMIPDSNAPAASPFDNAQWPAGPVGAPSQAQASTARPPEADQNPIMGLFQRSVALQKDPLTGEFIDPAAAAKARPNIFHGLFG